jgi:hypothetical protein
MVFNLYLTRNDLQAIEHISHGVENTSPYGERLLGLSQRNLLSAERHIQT